MAEPDPRLARILVSNDDGIDAPGIKLLETIARELSPEVWVVAPEMEQSGAGHSLTTRRPIRLTEVGPHRYIVDGTPTDCVLLGLKRLLRGRLPSLVLSGVNAGTNIAEDLTYSGTCAAAMEATLFGVPAIALSQEYKDRGAIPWSAAEAFTAEAIRRIVAAAEPWPKDTSSTSIFRPCRRQRCAVLPSPIRASACSATTSPKEPTRAAGITTGLGRRNRPAAPQRAATSVRSKRPKFRSHRSIST